jgi:hypothetical protein
VKQAYRKVDPCPPSTGSESVVDTPAAAAAIDSSNKLSVSFRSDVGPEPQDNGGDSSGVGVSAVVVVGAGSVSANSTQQSTSKKRERSDDDDGDDGDDDDEEDPQSREALCKKWQDKGVVYAVPRG